MSDSGDESRSAVEPGIESAEAFPLSPGRLSRTLEFLPARIIRGERRWTKVMQIQVGSVTVWVNGICGLDELPNDIGKQYEIELYGRAIAGDWRLASSTRVEHDGVRAWFKAAFYRHDEPLGWDEMAEGE